MSPFLWSARVYWEDTDAGGVVFYANYQRYLERARTEWLRLHGISQRALAQEAGVLFSVVALEARFRHPARLDDLLAVSCEPRRAGPATVVFSQSIWRERAEGTLLLTASVRVACVDTVNFRARRLPEAIVALLPERPGHTETH